jgi:DNA-binding CsgD family transcriptional regulator
MSKQAPHPDLRALIRAAYAAPADSGEWLQTIARVAAFDERHGFAYTYNSSPESGLEITGAAHGGQPPEVLEWVRLIQEAWSDLDPALVYRIYNSGPLVRLGMRRAGSPGEREAVASILGRMKAPDTMLLFARDPDGCGMVVGWSMSHSELKRGMARESLERAASHLNAARRLRRHLLDPSSQELRGTLNTADAILNEHGKLQHARGTAQIKSIHEALARATRQRERSMLRSLDDASALALWQALVRGTWSLVDDFDSDGKRFVLARRNDPHSRELMGLTDRERTVAAFAAMGHSNKAIAYELGLSPATVTVHCQAATRKLGLRSRAELITYVGSIDAGSAVQDKASPPRTKHSGTRE